MLLCDGQAGWTLFWLCWFPQCQGPEPPFTHDLICQSTEHQSVLGEYLLGIEHNQGWGFRTGGAGIH